MKVFLDLFSGIGGFALAAYRAGLRFDKHYFSEIDNYAVQIYRKRFPEAIPLGDIRDVNYSKLPKGKYLVAGGFPCQPHSLAGKRGGQSDKRDLWPECARVLCELQPEKALFENVPGLLTSPGKEKKGEFFNRVLSDIHQSGYHAEWIYISANDAGAPHKRNRVWIVSYPHNTRTYSSEYEINKGRQTADKKRKIQSQLESSRLCGTLSNPFIPDTKNNRNVRRNRQRRNYRQVIQTGNYSGGRETIHEGWKWWEFEPNVGRVADGIPFRLDRIRCIGNAIVPQCAELIFSLPAFDMWRIGDI
jgi:DNA (cytosine-5)-methyltransferase 1